jgi:pilus assembly protein CpaF
MSILKRLQGADSNGNTPPSNSSGVVPPSIQTRRVTAPASSAAQDTYQDLKTRVQNKLISGIDPGMDVSRTGDVRRTIQELFEQILNEENIVLSRPERARMFEQIAAEILGFGPLQPLLEDRSHGKWREKHIY